MNIKAWIKLIPYFKHGLIYVKVVWIKLGINCIPVQTSWAEILSRNNSHYFPNICQIINSNACKCVYARICLDGESLYEISQLTDLPTHLGYYHHHYLHHIYHRLCLNRSLPGQCWVRRHSYPGNWNQVKRWYWRVKIIATQLQNLKISYWQV